MEIGPESNTNKTLLLQNATTIRESSNYRLLKIAETALLALEDSGFEAYIVGGFLRDALLGREQHDIDIATSALPDECTALFEAAGYPVHPTGIAHGTITVVVEGEPLEITTFRGEGAYTDHRHPDSVTFVQSIEEDLARRDFTINALAYNPTRGLVDPFDGASDIERRIIRTVGDPETRFQEDTLRILRGCRLASELGFAFDDATLAATNALAGRIAELPAERVLPEMTRLLCGKSVFPTLMECPEVMYAVVPELRAAWGFDQNTPFHVYTVYEHIAHTVEHIEPSTPLNRWVALLHDIGKPARYAPDAKGIGHFPRHSLESARMAEQIASRLRMPSDFTRDLITLVTTHDYRFGPDRRAVRRMLHTLDGREDLFASLMAIKRADCLAKAPHCRGDLSLLDEIEAEAAAIAADGDATCLRNLALTGKDLIDEGLEPGPIFHTLLEIALQGAIEDDIPNEKDAILAYLHKKGLIA